MFKKFVLSLGLLATILALAGCMAMPNENNKEAEIHLQLGVSSLSQGNYPQAMRELLIAEKLSPENPVIQNNLGLAYYVRERYDLAEKHILKALEINDKYTDARNNLTSIYIDQSKFDKALVEANKVINDLTYSSPEKAQNNLGLIYFKTGKYNLAKKTFQKSLEMQKDNCTASSYYGRSLYELKDLKRASEALDQAVGFCQRLQFDEPHYYSALTYYELGNAERAEARLEELIKIYPQGKYVTKAKGMLETIRK